MDSKQLQILLIQAAHLATIAFLLLAPLMSNPGVLVLHNVAVPAILVHWMTNSDVCILTLMESKLRGIPSSSTFFDRLVGPVYRLPQGLTEGNWAYAFMLALWAWGLARSVRTRAWQRWREMAAAAFGDSKTLLASNPLLASKTLPPPVENLAE